MSTRRWIAAIAGFVFATLLLSSCDKVDQMTDESREWRKTMEESVRLLQQQIDTSTKALPWERYMRLVEAGMSDDPKDRELAERFAERILNVDLKTKYEVSLAYGFTGERLRSDFFFGDVPTAEAVRQRCSVSYEPASVRNSLQRPASLDEQKEVALVRIRAAIDELGAKVKDVRTTTLGPITTFKVMRNSALDLSYSPRAPGMDYDSALAPGGRRYKRNGKFTGAELQQHVRRERAAQSIYQAFTALYESVETPLGAVHVTTDYPFAVRPWLFVLVDEEDLMKEVPEGFVVRASAHMKGDIASRLSGRWPVSFTQDEFLAEDPVRCGRLQTPVRWVVHNLSEEGYLSADMIAARGRLQEILSEWEAERRELD